MFYRIARRVLIVFIFIFYRLRVVGKENIPEGAVIACSNHTALTDPIHPIKAFEDQLFIMAKEELSRVPLLGPALKMIDFIPVKRDMSDLAPIKTCMNLLKNDKKLLIYPEGTRVRPGKTVTTKTGAVMLAYRCGVPLLPMYTTSGNKPLFSRIDLVIGKPYMVECADKRPAPEFYAEQTDVLMAKIFALKPETRK